LTRAEARRRNKSSTLLNVEAFTLRALTLVNARRGSKNRFDLSTAEKSSTAQFLGAFTQLASQSRSCLMIKNINNFAFSF
jgi:hypothetical protein